MKIPERRSAIFPEMSESCYYCGLLIFLHHNTERDPWLNYRSKDPSLKYTESGKGECICITYYFSLLIFSTYVLRLHIICFTPWLTERCLKQLFRKERRKFEFYLSPTFLWVVLCHSTNSWSVSCHRCSILLSYPCRTGDCLWII